MIRLRSISVKLLVAICVAVILPFLGFIGYVRWEMGNRLSRDVVIYFLKSKVSDLADQINQLIDERKRDLRLWVQDPRAQDLLLDPQNLTKRSQLENIFNHFCAEKKVYDLLLVADLQGNVVAFNTADRDQTYLAPSLIERLEKNNIAQFAWFQKAFKGDFAYENWHISPLLHADMGQVKKDPRNYAVGFAGPIRHPQTQNVIGVCFNLMNWSFVQVEILDQVNHYFRDLQTPESYQSGYAWLWKSDGDSIIGHQNRELYGDLVTGPQVDLPQLTEAALSLRWGVFPEYEFPPGTKKNAAFKWTKTEVEGGFGWIVGIGINNQDIFATVEELGQNLSLATLLIIVGIASWTWIISKTITRPVKNLILSTNEIARGNLTARVPVETRDEIGTLAHSFNHMTEDLANSREKLIRAEKAAAWHEMARQIAHEIKNPLTPMRLSTNVMQKAYKDDSKDFAEIFQRTTTTILRQIEALRKIATDFSAFAGKPVKQLEKIDVVPFLQECLDDYSGWAKEKNIALSISGQSKHVIADREEFRRLFINLFDNAFEAVERDGKIDLFIAEKKQQLSIEIKDSGHGFPADIKEKLFEPYFSTKTTGTGLGLAIAHRIVTDLGGTIRIESEVNRGAKVIVSLPYTDEGSHAS